MKRFLTAILCILILGCLVWLVFRPPGVKSSDLTTEKEETGNRVVTSFVDEEGTIRLATDKGYASVVKTLNDDGKTIREEYRDEDNSPVIIPGGYTAVLYTYTDGLATEFVYLGPDNRPVLTRNGYSALHRSYNADRKADTDSYYVVNADGTEIQVPRKEGYWQYKREYTGKYVTGISYLDQSGAPADTTFGYSLIERIYDETAGKIALERYYDRDGSPVKEKTYGSYGYRARYDAESRLVEKVFLGPDGEPANSGRGYSTERITYTDTGILREYYDAEGARTTIGRFQYGTLTTADGQVIYLNADGEPTFRLDNFLHNHRVVVLIGTLLLTVAALVLNGNAGTIFLVLYLLFILFMTLLYRETGDSRAHLELFWSYRQIANSTAMRDEVLNNIWLFVPLGAALGKRAGERKKWWLLLLPILLSFCIEAFQYFTGLGLCETDDVISNTLGAITGFLIAKSFPIREEASHVGTCG